MLWSAVFFYLTEKDKVKEQIWQLFTSTSRRSQGSLVLYKAEQVVEGRSGGLDSGLGAGAHISLSARSGPNAVTAGDK